MKRNTENVLEMGKKSSLIGDSSIKINNPDLTTVLGLDLDLSQCVQRCLHCITGSVGFSPVATISKFTALTLTVFFFLFFKKICILS